MSAAKLKCFITLFGAILLIFPISSVAEGPPPLEVVEYVDLNRYLGKWYEIASYPAWFQKGCVASTAEYSMLPDGKIRVVNIREVRLQLPESTYFWFY